HSLPRRGLRTAGTAPHVVPGRGHGWCLLTVTSSPGSTEDIAGGEMTSVEPLVQEIGLRALAPSRRAQQHQPPRGLGLARKHRAFCRRSFQPSGTIVLVLFVHGGAF